METMLADKYVVNFSVFQSLPDSWAIDQLFPILPIHRLNERPTEFGTLADITCDSDGKIEKFIDLRDIKETLPLHGTGAASEPYYLGVLPDRRLPGRARRPAQPLRRGPRGPRDRGRGGALPDRGRAARRVLRARPGVHELRPDRDPRLDRAAAAPGREPPGQEGRGQAIYRSSKRCFPRYTYLER